MRIHRLLCVMLSACAGDPTAVEVELAPSVISSLDGTTAISAFVRDDARPLADTVARASVAYTDRNGTPHDVEPVDGRTDERGVFHATIGGLRFDGTGTVTVETTAGVSGSATFTVLDRTPPVIEILSPTVDNRVGPGLPIDVQVHVTDEIGVSEITFSTDQLGGRTTIVASGALDTIQVFRSTIPAGATSGETIDLHALAGDLSGNLAAATPLALTVDAAITIATPPDLAGSLLADGTATQLVDPRAIVMSTQDNHLYVADNAATGACDPSCIWRVDATTGVIDSTPVVVGVGVIEGVAVDATSDNLFFSDRQNRIGRLTWNGTAYANPAQCVDAAQQVPQDPFHLVFDATLGILTADDNNQNVVQVATCTAASVGTAFSINGNFENPRGIALGAAGEIYVADGDRDSVSLVDRTTGAVSGFQSNIGGAYGLEWLAGGTSAYADSLLVAATDQRTVVSTAGAGTTSVAFLRDPPIDVVLAAGVLYIITSPSNGNRGRIYKVTGF